MPVQIDEVTADVVAPQAETSGSPSSNIPVRLSPEMEIRREQELHDYLAIRAARLRAD